MKQESYTALSREDLQKAHSDASRKEFFYYRLTEGADITLVFGVMGAAVGTVATLPAVIVAGFVIAAGRVAKEQCRIKSALTEEREARRIAEFQKNQQTPAQEPMPPAPQPGATPDFSAAIKKALSGPIAPAAPMQLKRRSNGPCAS